MIGIVLFDDEILVVVEVSQLWRSSTYPPRTTHPPNTEIAGVPYDQGGYEIPLASFNEATKKKPHRGGVG